MLCLDMRLVQRLRGERTQQPAPRDRSKSICVTSFGTKPPKEVNTFALFHRRASSAISSATDLISRRGVFSRRYYGSVEQLQQPELNGQDYGRRFRIENGDSPGEKDEMFGSPSTPVLENPEYQTRWYFKYFLGKLHQNYVGVDVDKMPFFLSVVLNENSNQCVPLYRAILFKKAGAQKISLPYTHNKVLTVKQILSNFPNMEKVEKGPKEIFSPDIQKDLLLLEEQEGSVNFKFGVIYMKQGQTTDDEILSNESGSQRFEEFLSLLGDTVRLKGWDKYRGGLDIKGYVDIFAVVSPEATNSYRLSVFSDEAVPLFGPSLPCPPVFKDAQFFREFLLVKLMNSEKATFETPTFSRKRERTLDMLIKDLYAEHVTDARMTMLNRRAFSDVLADTPKHSRLKEDSRQIEFVRIGQALKLEAIVRGDAPTSLASAGSSGTILKRSPWEANCFYPVFPAGSIQSGDSWGENKLVLATEDGVYVVEDGLSHRMIFDRTLQVRQLSVVEPHGIMLIRAGNSNREGKVYVFRLSQIDAIVECRSRYEIKEHRLEKTRGTHLYALSRTGGSRLRMCVAIGRKLLLFQWKHSAAWTAWCPANDTDTVDGFTFLWELLLNESPSMITVLDCGWNQSSPSHGDIYLCVGYKNHWDIVNGRTGIARHLHTVDSAKAHLVAALDLYEDQEVQLLLCYNHTCHFQKINEDSITNIEFDFHWNSVPTDIVCAFPYVIAFTSNTMEIRLVVNGNLVHTMTMPKLQLLTSKNDVFFSTTSPEFFPNKTEHLTVEIKSTETTKLTPPQSPNASPELRPLRLYRIPIQTLSRHSNSEHKYVSSGSTDTWKSSDFTLGVPEQPRVSRSATSSPIPPTKGNSLN
ncbi:GTPase-activating Rap/Ran-GAP domain-like protein 3 isoform X2 [Photinus pyralis]|uniref:GTPase-activating Rap/Ran-GAP domain-like protein 3 isoform X2 n=1 Tax=Photinus pyralis TaxID=7054 RepID=UPI001266F2A6|nr:GTPase-activating Rap/Ran-GAP domain-like protein 3 isoform X2 [Photinus pyralis]